MPEIEKVHRCASHLQLASIEWRPQILRAAFEPRVLSPRIWPNLMRIDAKPPELMRVLIRPRVLSPDIDLQLFHLRVRTRVLNYHHEPLVRHVMICFAFLYLY